MMRLGFKGLLREIKNSFGRFFAIFAIVAIGVAFFAGVTASSSDMKFSSDKYYDEYNMSDLRILSNIGFTEEDVEQIRKVDGVEAVSAGHAGDVIVNYQDSEAVAHIMSMPNDQDRNDKEYINQLRIKEGRLPREAGECVVKYESTRGMYAIGDVITFSSGDGSDIAESFHHSEYTVVGIVYSPYYVSYELGSSDIGSGHVSYCIYLRSEEFKEEYYTELFATVSKAKEKDTYSDEYFELVDSVADKIDAVSSGQFEFRREDIRQEFEQMKADKTEEIKQNLYDNVVDAVTRQYQAYYPGYDVSAMVQPYIEPEYEKALNAFDFQAVYDEYDRNMEEMLNNTQEWKWYELTRKSQYSFMDYQSSADRMERIAAVFPMFFIIVAGLVCLTTMTRMVDEQRELIGTYKALGYGKVAIAFRYVAYAFIASFLGGVAGCIAGLKIFPLVIYNSWNIIYQMPEIAYEDHTLLSIIAVSSLIVVTLAATVYSCYNTLAEVPSVLMRPKSPKSGKKIMLERVGFIWKHISFTWKVTLRNLFLYKKRFMMTIVGIAGCGALIMAGFGIKDSIETLIDNQFSGVFHYNCSMLLESSSTVEDMQAVMDSIKNDADFAKVLADYAYTADVSAVGSSEARETEITIVRDLLEYKDFVTFRTRKKHDEVLLSDDGIIISEKLAKDMEVKIGDEIIIEDSDGTPVHAKIGGIMEMYVGHYIFMTENYFEQLFGYVPQQNRLLGMLKDDSEEVQKRIGDNYLSLDSVRSLSFIRANISRFENMIQSLNLVTWVLIISAGLLAFVVLYNLTNVNISERIREIATIKVLGFYDLEVGAYVYRESIILTLIGGVLGLFLGKALHAFIMETIEMDAVMFGNYAAPSSYLLSYGITIVFALIVNVFMYGVLKKVAMVESLKSIE